MNAVLRLLVWLLAITLIAAPIVALVKGWAGTERWPLRTLRIEGAHEWVDPAQVRAAVLPYAQRGFFAMPMNDAQAAVARLPWVDTVEISRQWPDVLQVHVTEHVPFAHWGDDLLLSTQGRIFPPVADAHIPEGLPKLHGADTAISDVVALYNTTNTRMQAMGLRVEQLQQDARGSWSMQLSNGTEVILGSQEPGLRLQRFANLLPRLLASRDTALTRADLRYPNGFALQWGEKQGSEARDQRPVPLGNVTTQREASALAKNSLFPFPNPQSPIPAPTT